MSNNNHTMELTKIKSIYDTYYKNPEDILNKSCTIIGRVYATRSFFVHINDGSTVKILQCVCDIKNNPTYWKQLTSVYKGTTIEIAGIIVQSLDSNGLPRQNQPFELIASEYKIIGTVHEPEKYPLVNSNKFGRNLDFLRTIPHLRHHDLLFVAVQLIKQKTYEGLHQAFSQLNINQVQATHITENECEEGACPFTVTSLELKPQSNQNIDFCDDFFKKKVYLTVSGQLHLEATVCGTLTDCYCMTTAFRAEKSDTKMHLAEFCMPEWEIIGNDIIKNMDVGEYMLKYIINHVLKHCSYELDYLDDQHMKGMDKGGQYIKLKDRLLKYYTNKFIKISHHDCVKLMLDNMDANKVKFVKIPSYDDDLSREHERYITDVLFDNMPVFVTKYPKNVKAFYMPVVETINDVEYVDNYDLLFPFVGEIIGGSQRIHDYDILVTRMKEMNMDITSLDWYLDLRKYGSVMHGGAGLGLGRLFMVLTGLDNIKDLQEFPRSYGSNCYA